MKTITICGSAKNHEYILKLDIALQESGFYVFTFPDARHLFKPDMSPDVQTLMAAGLTYDHFEKIKLSDIVLFANLDGYMGNSATLELGVAIGNSKHTVALNHDKELARECLFKDVIGSEDIPYIVEFMKNRF